MVLETLGSHICNHMDGPQGPYSNCKKLGRERQIPYNYLIFRIKKIIQKLKNQAKIQRKDCDCHKWGVELGEMAELFLFFIRNKRKSVNCSVTSNSSQLHGLQPSRILCGRGSPGKNTGVGSQSLLQGFFPKQRLDPSLLHCRQILYYLH